jgi:SAM-dependent methyltransferase
VIDDPDRSWEYYGKHDPYFGVLTLQEYRRGHLDEDARARFFQSGEAHLGQVVAAIKAHLDPNFAPQRGLDFGCGVGRVLLPMAGICRSLEGADVSESMLEEARSNCALHNLTHVSLTQADDNLTQVSGTFDFIHSTLVFQHIPRRRGERLLSRLLERLEDGGVGALHFTYARAGRGIRWIDWARKSLPLLNGLVNILVLRLPFRYPLVQMNVYNLGVVFRILHHAGCHPVVATPTVHVFSGKVTTYGTMLYFRKTPTTGL